jgi:uncharacterized protein (TIGR03089 family)
VSTADTPAGLLARALAADPSGPLLTFYDDATGERIELSATTLENWVAKTANLLQDSGVEPGARAAVLLPAHWQTAAILLGCWSVGLEVVDDPEGADVAFAGPDRFDEALAATEVYGLSLAPMAAPLRNAPPGIVDYSTEVRGHGDRFAPYQPVDPALYADLVQAARTHANDLELSAKDRVLVVDTGDLDWLLVPLAAGASIVLCRNLDPARLDERAASERVTAQLRPRS